MNTKLPILQSVSDSRARAYRRCPRLEFYQYEQGLIPVPKPEDPRYFGKAFHAAQEVWWRAEHKRRWQAVRDWLELPLIDGKPAVIDPYTRAHLSSLMLGYTARWEAEGFEVLAIEKGFELPLINPHTGHASKTWKLKGFIDAIVRTASGVWVVEHKTTAEDIGPGSDYWRHLRIDSQCSTYIDAAASVGFDVKGVIYDVTKKSALRPYKATPVESRKYTKDGVLYAKQHATDEPPDEYASRILTGIQEDPNKHFQRCEVVRLEGEVEEAQSDLWMTALALRESQRSGRFPRNPDGCFKFRSACDYFDVCTHAASINDPTLFVRRESRATE